METRFIKFENWFTKYKSIMAAVEEVRIVGETEKAVKLAFDVDPKYGRSFIGWAPKSGVITSENAAEKEAQKQAAIAKWRAENPKKAAENDARFEMRNLKSKGARKLTRLENSIKKDKNYETEKNEQLNLVDRSQVGWIQKEREIYANIFKKFAKKFLNENQKFNENEKAELAKIGEI